MSCGIQLNTYIKASDFKMKTMHINIKKSLKDIQPFKQNFSMHKWKDNSEKEMHMTKFEIMAQRHTTF